MQLPLSSLAEVGFSEICEIGSLEELMHATAHLGEILPLNNQEIQTITPTKKGASASRSFSYHYGLEAFPLHTDTSFWEKPARYAIFYLQEPSPTQTLILPKQETSRIFHAFHKINPIFSSKTINGHIYTLPWFGANHSHIRFDPCFMSPANKTAEILINEISNVSPHEIKEITWSGKKALIIDNWLTLHGRGPIVTQEKRNLIRIYRGIK